MDSVTEASKQQKQYTAHDLQVLLDHAHNQKTSLCDSFITAGSPEENRALLKRSAKQAELKDLQGDDAGDKPARKRAKKFDGDRDGPKYYQHMKLDIEKLEKKIPLVTKAFDQAITELQGIEEHKKANDPALQGFLRKLQFRAQVFNKWRNDDTVVMLHNVYVSKDVPTASPTLFPLLHTAATAELAQSVSEVIVVVVSVRAWRDGSKRVCCCDVCVCVCPFVCSLM